MYCGFANVRDPCDIDENAPRQRFAMAHELGHLLAHDDQEIHQDRDIHAAENRRSGSEMRANAFAAAFLMLEREVEDWLSEHGLELDAPCRLATDLIDVPIGLGVSTSESGTHR